MLKKILPIVSTLINFLYIILNNIILILAKIRAYVLRICTKKQSLNNKQHCLHKTFQKINQIIRQNFYYLPNYFKLVRLVRKKIAWKSLDTASFKVNHGVLTYV